MSLTKTCRCGKEFQRSPNQPTQAWRKQKHCSYECRIDAQIQSEKDRKKAKTNAYESRRNEDKRIRPAPEMKSDLNFFIRDYAPSRPR